MKFSPTQIAVIVVTVAAVLTILVVTWPVSTVEDQSLPSVVEPTVGSTAVDLASEDDSKKIKECGRLFVLVNGDWYVRYSGMTGYYHWDKDRGEPSETEEKCWPTPLKVKREVPLKHWEAATVTHFPKPEGAKALCVEVGITGIETPYSALFLYDMESKTIKRHPFLAEGAEDESQLLSQWLADECYAAFGSRDGKDLPVISAEQISQAVEKHFQRLSEQYGLGCSVHALITTHLYYTGGI